MRQTNALSILLTFAILIVGGAIVYLSRDALGLIGTPILSACVIVLAFLMASAVKVVDQWQKIVVLRLGRFQALKGPGLCLIIPVIDTIPYWIDLRVLTSSFKAEKTLTKRHGARGCGRRALLEGGGPSEGGAGRRPEGRHRKDDALRHAGGPG